MRRAWLVAALLCACREKGAAPVPAAESPAAPAPPERIREQEPNDRAVDATPLQPGKPMRGTYLSADDEDWYRLELKPSAMDALRIEVTAVAGARPELEVRALADASLLATFRGTDELLVRDLSVHLADLRDGGLGDRGVADGVVADRGDADGGLTDGGFPAGVAAGGGYYLVLKGHTRRGAPLTPYTITTALEAGAPDLEIEPNDEVATAPVLALPIQVKGWIWPRKDVDVFRFHVGAGHAPVNLVLAAVRGVDLQLRLYELRGERPPEVIGSSDARRGEGEEKLIAVPLKEGDYAVEVSSPRNKDASATQAYTLTVQ